MSADKKISEKRGKRKVSEQPQAAMDADRYLLKGPMPDLKKMNKEQMEAECQMWRNIWGWVPSEVKYYIARTGQQLAITMRNYKRYLGVLLDTHWELMEVELGVYDKIYDIVDGKYYFERKIIKTRLGGLIDLQWIKERQSEEELMGTTTPAPAEEKVEEELQEFTDNTTQQQP